ncbi:MAG: sensor domain-containing protein [Actinomycetota bacterium]
MRAFGFAERARAMALLGVDVASPYRADVRRDTWWRPHLERFKDPATWTGIMYHLLMLPVGIGTFVAAVVLWSVGLGALFLPAYHWALPDPADTWIRGSWRHIHAPGELALVSFLGLLLVLATPWAIRGIAYANGLLVRWLLGPTRLTARVHELTESRAAAVDLAAADRRQIERDLHDGVQQRLVALAMDLGRAKEKLGSDPQRACSRTRGSRSLPRSRTRSSSSRR